MICWDDSEKNRTEFQGALVNIDDPKWTQLDYIVLSPGVPLHFPKPHRIVDIARANTIPLISDIELLYTTHQEKQYIAITGTNGKSTTTHLIGHILGTDFGVGGNIGVSSLALSDEMRGFVLELSSFQLDLTFQFKPNIAVLLNITPDHLDRHGSLENYIESKKRIWQNMDVADSLIIGVDNDVTNAIYEELRSLRAKKIIHFNVFPISAQNDNRILPHNKYLLGAHNRENALAACKVAELLGYSAEYINSKITDFVGLKHRMQFVDSYKNVAFYNDSKATNAPATSNALKALDNIFWLAGGVPKEGGIEELTDLLRKVKKAYLFGEAKNQFAQTLDGKVPYAIYENMHEALKNATNDALALQDSANVLLSPACASLDQFKNFEARGDIFMQLVNEYICSIS